MADNRIRFTNVEAFERDLEKLSKLIPLTMDEILRKIGFDFYAGVTFRTPVDTGYARSNWNISTNKIDTSIENETSFPDGKDNSAKAESINKQKISAVQPDKFRTGLYITNSLPYIVYLEQGRTKQLGKGKGFMVQRTLAQLTTNVSKEVKELERLL